MNIINLVNYVSLFLLIAIPLFLLYFKRKSGAVFLEYFIICLIIGVLIIFSQAWITNSWYEVQLNSYGYNFDAMNDFERYKYVLKADAPKVKNIERSIMGIGWPLKAILSSAFFFFYVLAVFLGYMAYNKFTRH